LRHDAGSPGGGPRGPAQVGEREPGGPDTRAVAAPGRAASVARAQCSATARPPPRACGRGGALSPLFDCSLVSNGGLAVIVTGRERARDLQKPPVYIRGMAQGHVGGDPSDALSSGAVLSREPAFRMAGLTLRDVDVVELY